MIEMFILRLTFCEFQDRRVYTRTQIPGKSNEKADTDSDHDDSRAKRVEENVRVQEATFLADRYPQSNAQGWKVQMNSLMCSSLKFADNSWWRREMVTTSLDMWRKPSRSDNVR